MGWIFSRVVAALGRPLRVASSLAGPADAAVVLGAPLRADNSPTEVVAERVSAGVSLWRAGLVPVVVFSGGRSPGARHSEPEATVMVRLACSLGLPTAAARAESRSRSTMENARYSGQLLAREGIRRIIVVTQPFHMRRACYWFRREGIEVQAMEIHGSLQGQPEYAAAVVRWLVGEYLAWGRLVVWEVGIRGKLLEDPGSRSAGRTVEKR